MTREQIAVLRKVQRARDELANRYGNLYGIKLGRWFVFNGEHAIPRGANPKETLRRFEERLASYRQSRGSSALHRARRAAA